MKVDEFNNIVEEQIARSTSVLIKKAGEYATEDRLHNFKVAAELQACTPKQALAGMMAKHTVSVYDLCLSEKPISIDMWNEKITDSINYLLLLRAVVEEDLKKKVSTCEQSILELDNGPYGYWPNDVYERNNSHESSSN